jgi:hypothetical protein
MRQRPEHNWEFFLPNELGLKKISVLSFELNEFKERTR